MSDNNNSDIILKKQDVFNLREFLEKYLFHWKWFVLGLLFSISSAFLYLRYVTPKYEVVSTILIQDRENQSISSELSAFADLGLASDSKSMFRTEIGILKSRTLMEKVVKKLNINKTYYQKGNFRDSELYGSDLPFKVHFFDKDSLIHQIDTTLSITPTSDTKFDLFDADKMKVGSYRFGENINSTIADFTVIPTLLTPIEIGENIKLFISKVQSVANYYRGAVKIEQVNRKSTLVNMTLNDQNKEKSKAILGELLEQYNIEAIIDKSLIAKNTDLFINERIDEISKELVIIDKDVENFKTSNKLTDIDSESNIILTTNNQLEKETVDLQTQLKLVKYVVNYIKAKQYELIPTNLGLEGASINETTLKYNTILLERNRIMFSSNSLNPIIVNLDGQIESLRISILESLNNLKSSISISLTDLKRQEVRIDTKINSVPKKERLYRDIQRSQKIIETLYLYLLQKREENAITLAVKAPNAKLIDSAFGSPNPVSPNSLIIYFVAVVMGFVIPFIIFYLLFLFDNKIHILEDLEDSLHATILGDVPKLNLKKSGNLIISNNDNSPFTEAFRILRTNIFFLLSKSKSACKTIFVSSTITGEGKSFTSINLAKILMLSSKKVLLIGGDIRNPKLAEYLNIPNKIGLTHYLADPSLKAETLIEKVPLVGFDILQGGNIAPNPSELLMNGRFDELLSYAKEKYDYIIIDTAPISMVTDTVFLSQDRADLFVYVIRANYLDKRMLKIPEKLNETGRIKNIAIVLNGTNPNGLHGYGYGYGYGFGYKGRLVKYLNRCVSCYYIFVYNIFIIAKCNCYQFNFRFLNFACLKLLSVF
jgi:capsular exopolysaccharide synthesis family protein